MKRKNERPPRHSVYDMRIQDRRTRTGWMWSTKLVSAVRAAILSVIGRPWRNTAEVICPMTDHISSTAARMTFMNPPVPALSLQPEFVINDDRAVDEKPAVLGQLDMDPVHWTRRRTEEIVGIPKIAAAMAGALEARQSRIGLGGMLTGVRILRDLGAGQNQVTGDVRKISRRAAEVGADQADGVKAVRVAVDHDPLVDQDRGRP